MKRHAYFSGKIAIETFPLSFELWKATKLKFPTTRNGRELRSRTMVWVQATQGVSQVVPRVSLLKNVKKPG